MMNVLQRPWLAFLVAGMALGASTAAIANGDRAFVPLGLANAVDVIDLDRQAVISTVTDTINTHGSALTPDGRQLILGSLSPHEPNTEIPLTEDEHAAHHGNGGTVSRETTNTGLLYVADTATSRLVRTLEVPGPVHHVLITQDGQHVVATGPNPNYLVQNEEGGSIFVSNAGNGTISEVDPQHWFVRRNMRVGGSPEHMVLSKGGERL
ncbi:YncE family protein [Halomonas organivorans]|uniref:DNA-binding beta-propeller fold protein YncE n=1 Tax=Halomonas organivorans TaxID=257772 RepID=A0A7W5BWC3_9GAMM|nr:hypothetical protein [Halomonas organivorans]MBB3140296.1 DNA-binding beta-propeller fold protein YncE [Halomonas organivorans]